MRIKKVGYVPVKGVDAVSVGKIASIDGRHIIGISNNMATSGHPKYSDVTKVYLYIIDTYTDKVVMLKTINKMKNLMNVHPEGSSTEAFSMKVHGDYIYTWLEWSTLIRIDKTGKVESIGNLPNTGRIAFSKDDMYISTDYDLVMINIPKD